MRLFYLVLLAICVVTACQPTDKAPASPRLLIDDGIIQMQLAPGDAPVETPLQLSVTGENIVEIAGNVSGVSMYMGLVPLKFNQNDGTWQADFLLGACSDPNMVWQAELQLTFRDGKKRTLKQQFHSSWH